MQERQPHRAGLGVVQLGDLLAGRVQRRRRVGGRGEDQPAVRVQPEPAVLALEQAGAEGVLDPPQRAGQAGLRDAELVRRRREVLGAGERHEPAQVVDMHPPTIRFPRSICAADVISRMTPGLSRCRCAQLPAPPPCRRAPAAAPLPTPAGATASATPEYRRISVALFAAGLATFALLYSTQPLLPALARDFR